MALQVVVFLVMFFLCTYGQNNYDKPISAADYAAGAKQGFSTNYFKTEEPLRKYDNKTIEDVYAFGFRNLRIRCSASMHSPEDVDKFNAFLDDLETVVNNCLTVGVWPIISWIHHDAEIHPNETYRQQYIEWWVGVAQHLQNKDYRLGFNLFTELGYTGCEEKKCVDSIRKNPETYTNWTVSVVTAIRYLNGNNKNRTLILTSPSKAADGLHKIETDIYKNDNNMLAEYHFYAAGPTKTTTSKRYWENGTREDKKRVRQAIKAGAQWAKENIPVYFGAWMTNDNWYGGLDQNECQKFACYFAKQLKANKIPWSMNVLDLYYNTRKSQWIEELQIIPRDSTRQLNMMDILRKVKKCM